MLKVLQFYELKMLQKFLSIHEARLKVLGFSAVTNEKMENPFDPDRFYLVVDIEKEPEPTADILYSVQGSSLLRSGK